jgi:HNH endonuclease
MDGMFCWMCERPVGIDGDRDWHIDHLIPLAREDYPGHPGGTLANPAIACRQCNSWKRAKLLPSAVARYHANVGAQLQTNYKLGQACSLRQCLPVARDRDRDQLRNGAKWGVSAL